MEVKIQMPISSDKTRINVYLSNDQYAKILQFTRRQSISISSLFCMLADTFLDGEASRTNTWTLNNRPPLQPTKVNKNKSESEIINDFSRDDYNPYFAAMYNLDHDGQVE